MPTARAKHLMPCRRQLKKRQIITRCGVMLPSSGTIWLGTRRSCWKPNDAIRKTKNIIWHWQHSTLRLTTLGPREVGVRELLDLSDDRSLRRNAMHRSADDALRRNQITRALEYARDLDSLSNRDFSDRLLLLSILKATNDAETQSLLEQLKKGASDDAVKIGALIGWMNRSRRIRTTRPLMLFHFISKAT